MLYVDGSRVQLIDTDDHDDRLGRRCKCDLSFPNDVMSHVFFVCNLFLEMLGVVVELFRILAL